MREHYNLKKVSLIVLLIAILLASIFGMCLNEDESLKMEDFSFNLPEGYLEQMHRKEMPFNRRNEVKSHSLP